MSETEHEDGNGGGPELPPRHMHPWEIFLRQSVTDFERLPDGAMLLQFAAATPHPRFGAVQLSPSVVVYFSADGWEHFKRQVGADGVQPPAIETATVLPDGLRH